MILLFDIDGTLIHTGGAGGAALREAFRKEFGIDRPGQVPFSGRTDRGIGTSLFQLHGIEDSDDNWRRLHDGYVTRLADELPRREGRILPGILTLLERLTARDDVVLGLLTGNVLAGARIKLQYFGLYNHFQFGGFGDDHRDRDEVARTAMGAAREFVNGRFTDVWVIGDTPLDVSCARAINARVIAVATGIHPHEELAAAEPDHLLNDLSDTDQLFSLLWNDVAG